MVKDNYVHGVGLGNFSINYMEYQSKLLLTKEHFYRSMGDFSGEIRYPFNDFLLILIEQGALSLICFLSIVFYLARCIMFSKETYQTKLIPQAIALICILFSGLTSYPLSVMPISIFFWIIIASINSKSDNKVLKNNLVQPFVRYFVVFIASISLYFGASYLFGVISWLSIAQGKENISKLPSLYNHLKFNPSYLCSVGDYYYNIKNYEEAVNYYLLSTKLSPSREIKYSLGECYIKLGKYTEAERQFLEVNQMIPYLLKPRYLLAMLYFNLHEYPKFVDQALILKTSIPKINSLEVQVMKKRIEELLDSCKYQL